MNQSKGFGLFEVIISLAIVSIVLMGFAESISQAYLHTLAIHQKIKLLYQDQ